jgi:hypothetical protein
VFVGVNVLNPLVYLAVALAQSAIVVVACIGPALRASRVDHLSRCGRTSTASPPSGSDPGLTPSQQGTLFSTHFGVRPGSDPSPARDASRPSLAGAHWRPLPDGRSWPPRPWPCQCR